MKIRLQRTLITGVAMFAIALSLPSCTIDKDPPLDDPELQAAALLSALATPPPQPCSSPEICGNWSDDYTGIHSINATEWTVNYGTPEVDTIVEFSNTTNTLYILTPSNAFNPNTYSRIVWTEITASTFYYCIVVYNKPDLVSAKSDPATADSSNLASGCGGFAWTKMSPR
jgi:hypothetical protein